MDVPITDIVFVCSLENVPKGYIAIEKCPCGHSAQLWEKVLGGHSGTRYLCYTKENKDDNKVVESVYIPGPSQQYLKKGFKIITDTVEKEEPMRHKQLAIKRVLKSDATIVMVDLIICQSKDDISKIYTKLMKVNGCRIAFRTAKYVPPADKDLSSSMGKLSVSRGASDKSGGSQKKTNLDSYSPSSSTLTSSAPTTHTDLSSYCPSPVQGRVKVKVANTLASAPLPPTSSSQSQPPPPSQQPSSSASYPALFKDSRKSSHPNISPHGGAMNHNPYQPPLQPVASQQATPTSVPSLATSYGAVPLPYQMNPGPSHVIQPYMGYMGAAAYDRGHPSGGQLGYPSAPLPSNANYDTNIGFSLGARGNTQPPAFQYQQQQQPGYPIPPGYGNPPPQRVMPPKENQSASGGPSYGFNF